MTELSHATQAVLDAAAEAMECPDNFLPYERDLMAAALRAAADQVVPITVDPRLSTVRWELIKIAAELENK